MEPVNLHELTAAYALDALDAADTEAYEAHLGQCEPCRAELATLSEAATALAWGVESPPPPARLRESILAAAATERSNVVPLHSSRPWLFGATAAAAAVAACAAIALGVWASGLSHSLDRERAARGADARAVAILSDQASRRVALRNGNGLVAVDRSGEGVLVVRSLSRAPAGKTYEAWVISKGSPAQPAGLFEGGGASTVVVLRHAVPPGAVVAATLERAGGVDAPTQAPLFTAQA